MPVPPNLLRGAAAHGELVQHRQREGRRLAGAGLGAAEQVVAVEHHGNGLGLDRGGGVVAVLVHGLQDGRGQLQFVKVHWKQQSALHGAVASARPARRVGATGPVKADGIKGGRRGRLHVSCRPSCPRQKSRCCGQLSPGNEPHCRTNGRNRSAPIIKSLPRPRANEPGRFGANLPTARNRYASTLMAQYVYTMNKVSKTVPPKRQILKDISLSFLPGRQDRRARPERLRQVLAAQDHGRRRQGDRGRSHCRCPA